MGKRKFENDTKFLIKTVELENYLGCKDCKIELKQNFTYKITRETVLIKHGEWDYLYGIPPVIMVDKDILGVGQFKINDN